jgi:Mg2+ and Co2+ transporter CorA
MTDILHHSGTNPDERKRIEAEQEAWRTVNAMFEDKEKAFLKALHEKEKALDEKEKALAKSEEMNADLLRQIEQLKQNLKK